MHSLGNIIRYSYEKYIEIYNYYKQLIESEQLKSGDKMPSVRKATKIFNVSKTTVQNAYFDLQADGYIIAAPKSGYYVTEMKAKSVEHHTEYHEKTKSCMILRAATRTKAVLI